MIGEAVKRLSPEFRDAQAAFHWSSVAGLRDILVHTYERVDQREIWNIATTSVPGLLASISPLLPEEPRPPGYHLLHVPRGPNAPPPPR